MNSGDTSAIRIYPPKFPKYNREGIEGSMSRADLWDYAMLCGWRTAFFEQHPDKPQLRQALTEMTSESGPQEWYFDCDGHYIDVKKDEDGKYSVFFRDRSTGAEAWLDQAEQPNQVK